MDTCRRSHLLSHVLCDLCMWSSTHVFMVEWFHSIIWQAQMCIWEQKSYSVSNCCLKSVMLWGLRLQHSMWEGLTLVTWAYSLELQPTDPIQRPRPYSGSKPNVATRDNSSSVMLSVKKSVAWSFKTCHSSLQPYMTKACVECTLAPPECKACYWEEMEQCAGVRCWRDTTLTVACLNAWQRDLSWLCSCHNCRPQSHSSFCAFASLWKPTSAYKLL